MSASEHLWPNYANTIIVLSLNLHIRMGSKDRELYNRGRKEIHKKVGLVDTFCPSEVG